MLGDDEINGLYHYLLGRAPEGPETIGAFRNYYQTLDSGRRAILLSTEFAKFFERQTGQIPNLEHNVAASLGLFFLNNWDEKPELPSRDEPLRSRLKKFYLDESVSYLAVVVGHPAGHDMSDLLPLGGPASAVLHISPEFPPRTPAVIQLADRTTVFQLGADATTVESIMASIGRAINALYLLDSNAGSQWVDSLRRHFAEIALIVVGRCQSGFDAARLEQEIRQKHDCNESISLDGLGISQVGGWLLPVTYDPPPGPFERPVRESFPSLAIAAIVRNEAACIANMLRSTVGVASYYAILDTGSSDATMDIARSFLSGSGVPYSLSKRDRAEFDNSFAAMRNAVLAQIPAWISWVLMLDGDEELVPEDEGPLLRLIGDSESDGPLCYALPRYNFATADKSGLVVDYPDIQIRLLRNTPDRRVFYTGRVHETVKSVSFGTVPLDASSVGCLRGGPHIHHLVRRYRTPDEESEKQRFYDFVAQK